MKCDLCGMNVPDEKIKHINIKGNLKSVCEGYVIAIKGFA